MLTAGPLALGKPVTHADLLAALQQAGASGGTTPRICLQARRYSREGPYWLCAELLELGCSDAEWFKVRSAIDTWWAHGRDLRLCSPDGRCYCDNTAQPSPAPAHWQGGNDDGNQAQAPHIPRHGSRHPTWQAH